MIVRLGCSLVWTNNTFQNSEIKSIFVSNTETTKCRDAMELSDLHIFATVARSPSLAVAAEQLHQTPSALSKALRRLEAAIGVRLFDRGAKQLSLNRAGAQLFPRALELLRMAEQTRSELMGSDARVQARIAGPSMLLWRYAARMGSDLAKTAADCALHLKVMFEDEAVQALRRGEVDFALVTPQALTRDSASNTLLQSDALELMRMVLCAGRSHPLAGVSPLSIATVLAYDFACPTRSLFCGLERAQHSDGWRDDAFPRRIRYWVDDLQVLTELLKSGAALAYLPEFALSDPELCHIQLSDCPYQCVEQALLVHAPTSAHGWQRRFHTAMLTVG